MACIDYERDYLDQHIDLISDSVDQYGASIIWERLKFNFPKQYNMLLLASLEMQAKELENLKGNT